MTRLLTTLFVAVLTLALVRYAPGFATDDRDLDPTLGAATRTALHNQPALAARNFLLGLLHGDLGESRMLGVPVRQLIAERGPTTLRILLTGTVAAWIAALAWAIALTVLPVPLFARASTLLSALLLCLPAAAIAALLLNADCPPAAVLAVALVPKIFQVARSLMAAALDRAEVLAARARGLSNTRILLFYVAPRIAAPLLAWLASTAGLAIAALVPIEVIYDVPGLGQLAWKAALARDLPLLVVLTILVAIIIQGANTAMRQIPEPHRT